MTQRTALIIATSLTAFLVVLGGGLAAQAATGTSVLAAPTAAPITAAPDAAVLADLQERDAQYQALLAQANTQLTDAYAQQQALQAQLDAAAATAASAAPAAKLSDQQAAAIALKAAPGATLLRAPQLVNLQGAVAYEVSLSTGLVYVDANSGQVLYNNAVAQAAPRVRTHDQGEHDDHGDGD